MLPGYEAPPRNNNEVESEFKAKEDKQSIPHKFPYKFPETQFIYG